MKNNLKDFINTILGFLILGVLGYIIYKIVVLFLNSLTELFKSNPSITVAFITGLIAFISMVVGKILEQKIEIDRQVRLEKEKIYTEFLEWLIESLFMNNKNSEEIIKEINNQKKLMIIYASDKVLKAWIDFLEMVSNNAFTRDDLTEKEKMKYFLNNQSIYLEKLILAIRKELGYKNRKIKNNDIMRVFLQEKIK